jgi:hypothetical protein
VGASGNDFQGKMELFHLFFGGLSSLLHHFPEYHFPCHSLSGDLGNFPDSQGSCGTGVHSYFHFLPKEYFRISISASVHGLVDARISRPWIFVSASTLGTSLFSQQSALL